MSSKQLNHIGEHVHHFRGTYLKTSCSTSSLFTPGVYPGLIAWITRGHSLFLRVQFLLSDVCEDTERNDLTEALGVVLRDAKVRDGTLAIKFTDSAAHLQIWHAFGLQASLIVPEGCCHTLLPSEDLVLALNHLQPSHPGIVTKNIDPSHTSTISAPRPPTGISSAYLNSVDIEFEFSLKRHNSLHDGRELEITQTVDNSYYEHTLLDVDVDQRPRSYSWLSCDTAPSSFALRYPSSDEQSSHRRQTPAQQCFTDLVKLMDAGLRTILCGVDTKPLSGLAVTHLSLGPGLVEIAPSIFNPDYLKVSWTFQSSSGQIHNGVENRSRRCGSVAISISISHIR